MASSASDGSDKENDIPSETSIQGDDSAADLPESEPETAEQAAADEARIDERERERARLRQTGEGGTDIRQLTAEEKRCELDFQNDVVAYGKGLKQLIVTDTGQRTIVINHEIQRKLKQIYSLLTLQTEFRPPPERRVAEAILLDPAYDFIGTCLLPIWAVCTDMQNETTCLEIILYILQRVAERPPASWILEHSSPELTDYQRRLERFKMQCLTDTLWRGCRLLVTEFRLNLRRGGLNQDDWERKKRIATRLDALKMAVDGNSEITAEDIQLQLSKAEDEPEGTLQPTAPRMATALRLEEELERREKSRREGVGRALLTVKSFLLNVLRIRISAEENRARNAQQILLTMIVRNELHLLYEDEWRLLITNETWQRARRSEERQDEWGFNLGSDQTILWRNLEFYFQIFGALSPSAFGHYLGRHTMKEYLIHLANDLMALEQCNEVEDPRLRRGILSASLDFARSNRFNPELKRSQKDKGKQPEWLAPSDKRRYTKFASRLHRETAEERVDVGEMPILADEILTLDDSTDFRDHAAKALSWLDGGTLASIMRTVTDFLMSAFNKFVQGWISDAQAELGYTQTSSSSICRLLNLICWMLRAVRIGVWGIIKDEAMWKSDEQVATLMEKSLMRLIVCVRGGLETKSQIYVLSRLRKEIKKPAKERSHALLRVAVRLLVEQQSWGVFFIEHSKRQLLIPVGKAIFKEMTKMNSPALLMKMLQNNTSFNAEMDFLVLLLTAMNQLLEVVGVSADVAKKTQLDRRKVFHKRRNVTGPFDPANMESASGDIPAEAGTLTREETRETVSLFTSAIRDYRCLTKLLFLAENAMRFPQTVNRAVLNLLGCIDGESWMSTVFAWDLQFVRVFHNIMISPDGAMSTLKSIILKSIKALAECQRTNKFVVIETLYASLLLIAGKDDESLFNNYEMPRTAETAEGTSNIHINGPWSPKEMHKLFVTYERHRLNGEKLLLRQMRRDIDTRIADEVELKLVEMNLVDPLSVGVVSRTSVVGKRNKQILRWMFVHESVTLCSKTLGSDEAARSFLRKLFVETNTDLSLSREECMAVDEKLEDVASIVLEDKVGGRWRRKEVRKENPPLLITYTQGRSDISLEKAVAVLTSLCKIMESQKIDDSVVNQIMTQLCLTLKEEDEINGPISLTKLSSHVDSIIATQKEILYGRKTAEESAAEHVDETVVELTEIKNKLMPLSAMAFDQLTFMLFLQPATFQTEENTPLLNLELRARLLRALSRMSIESIRAVIRAEREAQEERQPRRTAGLDSKSMAKIIGKAQAFRAALGFISVQASMLKPMARTLENIDRWCRSEPSRDSMGDDVLVLSAAEEEEDEASTQDESMGDESGVFLQDMPTSLSTQDIVQGYIWTLQKAKEDLLEWNLPLGPLSDFVQYQACLHTLGGEADAPVQPKRWKWDGSTTNKILLAKKVLLFRFAFSLPLAELGPLAKQTKHAGSEHASWELVTNAWRRSQRTEDETDGDTGPVLGETIPMDIELDDSMFADVDLAGEMKDVSPLKENSRPQRERRIERMGRRREQEDSPERRASTSLETAAMEETAAIIWEEDDDELFGGALLHLED